MVLLVLKTCDLILDVRALTNRLPLLCLEVTGEVEDFVTCENWFCYSSGSSSSSSSITSSGGGI